MSAVARRDVLTGGIAFVSLPFGAVAFAHAGEPRCSLNGNFEQGGLVVGKAEAGADVRMDATRLHVSPEGLFAFGLAYDQKKAARLAIRYADGARETKRVVPFRRQYEVQSVTGIPERFVTPSPEEQLRSEREHALVAEVRKRDSDRLWFNERFDWPVNGIISGRFGSQRILNGVPSAPHLGIDIAAGEGALIRAPASASVVIAQEFFFEGNYTLLDHGHGVFTSYLHQSRLLVKVGDEIARGAALGLVGRTGRATGPHLHWGMNWFQLRLDPSLSTRSPAPTKA